jgi:uncharacterized protein YbjT (DUF2867 family)
LFDLVAGAALMSDFGRMRVLITGAYGLLGAACLGKLRLEGHELVATGRSITQARRRFPYARWIEADFQDLTTSESWHALLFGIDAVLNCVDALQDGPRDDLVGVHVAAPAALFTACEQKGIRRVVHISAVGAGPSGATAFARTKGEAERDLSSRDLDWVILRPGLMLAPGVFGGTALMRGAAGIPFLTPIPAAKPIHIVAIEDVTETVAWALRPHAPGRITLELVHPAPTTLAALVAAYRGWLGLKPQRIATLPRQITAFIAWVADALSWLGWRSPMRTTAITQLAEGINGDPTGWIAATGIAPKSLEELLALHPATVQDRWFARLYILKPLAIAVLAAFWITSGIIALAPGWAGAMSILRLAGANPAAAKAAVLVGAMLDIALGLAVLVRRFSRTAVIAMLVISLGYVVAAAAATPHLLVDPLGGILKIFPVMLASLFVLAILDER